MGMESMVWGLKGRYRGEGMDSVGSVLEDKEGEMLEIVGLMDEEECIKKKIGNEIGVIVEKSVEEEWKKGKGKGLLGILGKKKEVSGGV